MNICMTGDVVEYSDVAQTAAAFVDEGVKPTIMLIRDKLGCNSLRDIAPLFLRWKAELEKENTSLDILLARGKSKQTLKNSEQGTVQEQLEMAGKRIDKLEQQLFTLQSKIVTVEKIRLETDALMRENRELAIGKAAAEATVASLREQLAKAEESAVSKG